MKYFDALVVGGGPAGSSCAGSLVAAGLKVAVLDRDVFPRSKLCAGWVTPDALDAIGFRRADYPYRFNSFDHLVIHVNGFSFRVRTLQHSIRRYEFDDWLLRRSGAEVVHHQVREIACDANGYTVDDLFRAKYLVGAGGTRCPVYRRLFREADPRDSALQIAAYELEFPYEWQDERCHLWFFKHGLPGYAWYVPKADGYLNCGVGAMAEKLKEAGTDIQEHWRRFVEMLAREGLVARFEGTARGYSYYMRGAARHIRTGNALLAGDAAGLSTMDLGEGIGPAIKSGLLAAGAISQDREYSLTGVEMTSADRIVTGTLIKRLVRTALGIWLGPLQHPA
jgi:flavin-dependent dehydrogenase